MPNEPSQQRRANPPADPRYEIDESGLIGPRPRTLGRAAGFSTNGTSPPAPLQQRPQQPKKRRAATEPPRLSAAGLVQNLKSGPTIMCLQASGLGKTMPLEAWTGYLKWLLSEAGNPRDPIERMLVEQLAMAHHNVMRLYVRAANSENLEESELCHDSAIRLLAELRRLALALKEFRTPAVPKIVNHVEQQNVAGNQQVAYVAAPADSPRATAVDPPGKKTRDSELVSKPQALDHEPAQQFTPQSEPRVGRQAEPAAARRADTRRPATTARIDADPQAVGKLHGAKNGRR